MIPDSNVIIYSIKPEGDSIIAATGLVYDRPALTNNTAHFLTVAGLRVIAPANVFSA